MNFRIAIAVLALAACESTGGGNGGGGAKVAESGTAKGSAGGFSAQMSAELAKAGVGEPYIPPASQATPAGSASGSSGSSGAGAAANASGSAASASGSAASASGSAASGSGAAAGIAGAAASVSGTAASGSATMTAGTSAGSTPTGSTTTAGTSAGSTSTGSTTTGGGAATSGGGAAAAAEKAATSGGGASAVTAVGAVKVSAKRSYVKPPADIGAIKLELEPNWERDMGEAGTFSLVVKVPNTDDTRVFSVRYGYEDQSAPIDCDSYRKFLEDRGAMKVTLNRQRGAACYIEGTDKGGVLAYRFLLTYGGKRLMCHGSLYKDGASAALGDLRDKVLLQAKKICETLAL